ncbi:MAG TPA: methyltransferase domain-containing protein [Actinomycetota bacterium]|nr:methyltransferase domain-containing protein [Actinomycetota bacterium]
MEHRDHVMLLREGIDRSDGPHPHAGEVWADLGSGKGAFTLALADLLGPGAVIHSVDRDERALQNQRQAMDARFPDASVEYWPADFTGPVDLPPLDGVLMANSLHFVRDKERVLKEVAAWLRPGGRLLIVEYDSDRGNTWAPYPISYRTWEALAARAGFLDTRLLRTIPSRFLGRIYSALSLSSGIL